MKAPDWWWATSPTRLARALAPAGAVYGALTAARMARPGHRAGAPVVCVGNLVAGGAGKTPAALALADLLQAAGERPAFLSRGYGRRGAGASGVIRVEPGRHEARQVGDEPLLLAEVAPTFVAADRRAAAAAAVAEGASVLLLDDGLQSPALAKTWTLAVIDGASGLGNGLCLPAGPLRARAERQWPFCDMVCVVGEGEAGARAAAHARQAGRPVASARFVLDPAAVDTLRAGPLLAFAGIGRPEKFAASLRAAGLDLRALRSFPDHHRFSKADCNALLAEAAATGTRLVTTTKDATRLPPGFPATAFPGRLVFADEGAVAAALRDAIRA